jgi:hypothetical protein
MDDAESRAWRKANGLRPPEDDLTCPRCGRVVFTDATFDPQQALRVHMASSRYCQSRP